MPEKYKFGLDPKWGLTDDDVVNMDGHNIVKISVLLDAVSNWVSSTGNAYHQPWQYWFKEQGIEVQVLRTDGGGWQKARLRFQIDFIPENPEVFRNDQAAESLPEVGSPLDDLRSDLNI
ncbi:MAG: hypothetical protein F6K62_12250 [Sphaerospermopsis sp. SIO1G2]|nr:hypothetical protein [Sphaerospermopsis sp. SIO1G2]